MGYKIREYSPPQSIFYASGAVASRYQVLFGVQWLVCGAPAAWPRSLSNEAAGIQGCRKFFYQVRHIQKAIYLV